MNGGNSMDVTVEGVLAALAEEVMPEHYDQIKDCFAQLPGLMQGGGVDPFDLVGFMTMRYAILTLLYDEVYTPDPRVNGGMLLEVKRLILAVRTAAKNPERTIAMRGYRSELEYFLALPHLNTEMKRRLQEGGLTLGEVVMRNPMAFVISE
jgi:hypothetical protein